VLNIVGYDQKTLQDFLARRHPDYNRLHPHWTFCEETYEGGRHWFRGNIFRYVKEGDKEYDDRVARAYRFNHTREVVDLIQKYIFKSPVARNWDDAPDYVKQFWRKSTLANLTIEQFMKMVSTASSNFGRVWVFVDSNKKDTVLTKADEQEQGARCYAYIVKPQDMLDIGFEDDGDLMWALVRERVRDDADPITSSGIVKFRYRLWTRDAWYLFEITDNADLRPDGTTAPQTSFNQMPPVANNIQQLELPGVLPFVLAAEKGSKVVVRLVDFGEVTIGRVPCFPVDNVIGDHKYSSPALTADIAYLDRAVANYLSNLDAIIQDQTFSQLTMPAQNVLPGDDKYEAIREMGTKRIFLYDGESGAEPKYISPDVKQAEVIVTVVNKIINEIYHSIGMGGERTKQDNSVGIDNSSGVAKAYDFERLNSLLTTKSASLENAENALIGLLAAWNGDPKFDPTVDEVDDDGDNGLVAYADTFDVRSLYDEFTVAERLALVDAPQSVRQEQMKQVVDKLFPALKADLKKKMQEEIENNWPISEADKQQIQGVISGDPSAKFPAKLIATHTPNGAGGSPKGGAGKSNPANKNPSTAKRQGQVTSETK